MKKNIKNRFENGSLLKKRKFMKKNKTVKDIILKIKNINKKNARLLF